MRLVIGGFSQGKLEYVKSKYKNFYLIDEKNFEDFFGVDDFDEDRMLIWNHFHLCVKKMLSDDIQIEDMEVFVFSIINKYKNMVIISDEIGYGIVPMDKFERYYREESGRILCKIAERADRVERVVMGIPTVIK